MVDVEHGGRHRTLEAKVGEAVARYFQVEDASYYDEPKAVHDSVWGTHRLTAWEASLLDNPLIQRLRGIHQTSLAFLTFPTALHTRFDHSLGVAYVAQRMLESLERNGARIDQSHKDNIRAACLLHDIGHGPFSHLSEEAYRHRGDFAGIIGSGTAYEGTQPHEYLSCEIIRSEPFRTLFGRLNNRYQIDLNIELVCGLIAGQRLDDSLQFVTDVVNGDFDADKLDYLHRDAHFSGIPLKVDLDRLFLSARIGTISGRNTITLDIRAAVPLEQIVFSKAVLYSTLYHHHKVRASDSLYKTILERLFDVEGSVSRTQLKHAADLLHLTDHDFLNWEMQTDDEVARKLMTKLVRRQVPKRAFVISMATLEDAGADLRLYSLRNQKQVGPDRRAYDERRLLREEIAEEIAKKTGADITVYDVTLDLPVSPTLGEAYLQEPDGTVVRLTEIFPVAQWVENYSQQRWQGHIFLPAEVVEEGAGIAAHVLERNLDVKFLPVAFKRAKVRPPA